MSQKELRMKVPNQFTEKVDISASEITVNDTFMEEENNDEIQKCVFCHEVFNNVNDISNHLVLHHGDEEDMNPEENEQILNILTSAEEDASQNKLENLKDIWCDICSKSFSTKQNMTIHQCRNQKCDFCSQYFTKKVINRHMEKCQKNTRKQNCHICQKSFWKLQEHIDTIHNGISKHENVEIHKIKCDFCASVFTGKRLHNCQTNLKLHIQQVHENKRDFSCYLCGKAFFHPYYVRRHINAHHKKIKPVSCDVCGKSFDSKRYLIKYHKNKCKGAHHCQICEKIYPNKFVLNTHQKKCGKQNDIIKRKNKAAYECNRCGKYFSTSGNLKSHIIRRHNKNPMKDSAMESNQELIPSKTSLAIEKNTKCDDEEQKKMFELKNTTKFVSILKPKEQQEPNLENLGQQRKLKVKTCSACGKSFNKRLKLKLHKCRNQKCDFCNKYFTTKVIQRHVDRCQKISFLSKPTDEHHRNLKKLSCDVCGKSFASKQNLQIHPCRNQKCDFCDNYFTNKVIQRHMGKCHQNPDNQHNSSQEKLKKYGCGGCDKFFSQPSFLKAHIIRIHVKPKMAQVKIEKTENEEGTIHESEKDKNEGEDKLKICISNFDNLSDQESKYLKNKMKIPFPSNPTDVHPRNLKEISCNVCGKSFISKQNLTIHKCRNQKCDYCDNYFTSKVILRHREKCQNNSNNDLPKQINISFDIEKNVQDKDEIKKEPMELDQELLLDIENLRKKCKEGGLSEETTKKLIERRQKLKGYCDSCCKSVSNLNLHIDKIHKGIKKYQSDELFVVKCQSCDSVFTGHNLNVCQHNLIMHTRRIHEGEKNFKCDLCGKSFGHSWHVRKHIDAKHKKIKLASCDVCGKSFDSERYLKKFHKCKGKPVNQCKLCKTVHANKSLLEMHKRNCGKLNDIKVENDSAELSQSQDESNQRNNSQDELDQDNSHHVESDKEGSDQDEFHQDESHRDESKQNEIFHTINSQDESDLDKFNQDESIQDEIDQGNNSQDEPNQGESDQEEPDQNESDQDELIQDAIDQSNYPQNEPLQTESPQTASHKDESDQEKINQEQSDQVESIQDEIDQINHSQDELIQDDVDKSNISHNEPDQDESDDEETNQDESIQDKMDQSNTSQDEPDQDELLQEEIEQSNNSLDQPDKDEFHIDESHQEKYDQEKCDQEKSHQDESNQGEPDQDELIQDEFEQRNNRHDEPEQDKSDEDKLIQDGIEQSNNSHGESNKGESNQDVSDQAKSQQQDESYKEVHHDKKNKTEENNQMDDFDPGKSQQHDSDESNNSQDKPDQNESNQDESHEIVLYGKTNKTEEINQERQLETKLDVKLENAEIDLYLQLKHGARPADDGQIHKMKCDFCDSVFTGKIFTNCRNNLKRHIQFVHDGEKNFVCALCDKSFFHPYYVRRHINAYHNKIKPASCGVCGRSFDSKRYLIKVHKDKCKGGHKCKKCKKVYPNKNLLRLHKNEKSCKQNDIIKPKDESQSELSQNIDNGRHPINSKELSCDVCGKSFASKQNLQIHPCRNHKCDFCNNYFTIKVIHRHMIRCEKLKKYKCDGCEKSFPQTTLLKAHIIRIHVEPKMAQVKIEKPENALFEESSIPKNENVTKKEADKLKICVSNFDSLSEHESKYLKNQMKTFHGAVHNNQNLSENVVAKLEVTPDIYEDVEELLPRNVVKMEVDQDDDLEVSVKQEPTTSEVHEKLKQYKCNECGKYFNQLRNLKSHSILIHKKKLSGRYCDICCKSYTNLKNHIDRRHKGIRKYESEELFKVNCESCDSIFTGHNLNLCQHNLGIHVKTVHGGEKNFKCDLCGKSFWHPWHVKRHINAVHKKLKPASCDVCGKSFDSERYLKKFHQCKGANECNMCKKVLPNKSLLKLHKTKCGQQNELVQPKDEPVELSQISENGQPRNIKAESDEVDSAEEELIEQIKDEPIQDIQDVPDKGKLSQISENGQPSNFELFSCDACGKSFTKKQTLVIHKCRNHKCDFCDNFFTNKVINRHMDKCLKNPKKFSSKIPSNPHVWKENKMLELENVIKPKIDEKLENDDQADSDPNATFEAVKQFLGAEFEERPADEIVEKIDNDLTPFDCSTCGQTFLTAESVEQHFKQVHEKEKPNKCANESLNSSNGADGAPSSREESISSDTVERRPVSPILNLKCDLCGLTNITSSKALQQVIIEIYLVAPVTYNLFVQ